MYHYIRSREIKVATRFAIAVHILTLLAAPETAEDGGLGPRTSEWLAGSVGVNPVIIRNITGMLRKAGLVLTQQGVAGAALVRPAEEINLLEVYRAVEETDIFAIHPRPNPNCPVGANIQGALEVVFDDAQRAMEQRLEQTTIGQLLAKVGAGAC